MNDKNLAQNSSSVDPSLNSPNTSPPRVAPQPGVLSPVNPSTTPAATPLPNIVPSGEAEDIPQPSSPSSTPVSVTPPFPTPTTPSQPSTPSQSFNANVPASPTPPADIPPQSGSPSGIIPPIMSSGKKGNGKLIAAIVAVVLLVIAIPLGLLLVRQRQSTTNQAAPSFTYHGGYYINLFGGGSDPNGNISAYNGEADCDPDTGICRAKNRITGQDYPGGYVHKWVCSGIAVICIDTTAGYISGPVTAPIHYIWDPSSPPSCNQTVQLDVYDSSNTLRGYLVWYSGICTASPSPTPVLSPSPSPVPTPVVSPSPSPSISPSPISSPSPSPSIAPSVSPSPTPAGAVIVSPTPKASPTPSPSPVAELPSAGNDTPIIVASGVGILLLIAGLVLAL